MCLFLILFSGGGLYFLHPSTLFPRGAVCRGADTDNGTSCWHSHYRLPHPAGPSSTRGGIPQQEDKQYLGTEETREFTGLRGTKDPVFV